MKKAFHQLLAAVVINLIIGFSVPVHALSISNFNIAVGTDSATFTWQTNEPANGSVAYGVQNQLNSRVGSAALTTDHSLTVTGLQDGTKYGYEAKAVVPGVFPQTERENGVFTTNDATPPAPAQGLVNGSVTATSVALVWQANQESDVQEYRVYRNGAVIATVTPSSYTDVVAVPLTQYTYQVAAVVQSGNEGEKSASLAVQTAAPDVTPPTLVDVSITSSSVDTVSLSWQTDEVANATIEYGVTQSFGQQQVFSEFAVSHSASLTGLTEALYYYQITTCDRAGNCGEARDQFFPGQESVALDVELPSFHDKRELHITGTTKAFSDVKFYVNDAFKGLQSKTQIGAAGQIDFTVAGLSEGNNTVRLVVEDSLGLSVEQSFDVVVDTVAPVLELNEIPLLVTDGVLVINGTVSEAVTLAFSNLSQETIEVNGTFTHSLSLNKGKNALVITARDQAGNAATIEKNVVFDQEGPRFIFTNLDTLSPSYSKDIEVVGQVSEPATVSVFLNDDEDPVETIKTEEDGSFAVEVTLARFTSSSTFEDDDRRARITGQAETSIVVGDLNEGQGFENRIRLVAVDGAGLNASTRPFPITYTLCGFGADWDIEINEPTPDLLIPRLLLEGFGQIGFLVNLRWQGPGPSDRAAVSNIRLSRRPLSRQDQDKFDLTWMSTPNKRLSNDKRSGYFLINVRPRNIGGNTTLEKEVNLSNHRRDEETELGLPRCTLPGLGCVALPLMVEVTYSHVDPYGTALLQDDLPEDSSFARRQGAGGFSTVTRRQRQCFNVVVAIDRQVELDVVSGLLESTVGVLDSVIKVIDSVLEPVNTAKKFVFIACAGTWVGWMFKKANEFFACKQGFLTGELDDPLTCTPSAPGESPNACRQCLEARASTLKFWEKSQLVCDRIMCPAAPTIQHYVQTQQEEKRELDRLQDSLGDSLDVFGGGEGSHCSVEELGQITYDKDDPELNRLIGEYKEVENLQLEVRKEDPGKPNDEYCEAEYLRHYNSVSLGLDELKESECVANPEAEGCGGIGKIPRIVRGADEKSICRQESNAPQLITADGCTYMILDGDERGHYDFSGPQGRTMAAYTVDSKSEVDVLDDEGAFTDGWRPVATGLYSRGNNDDVAVQLGASRYVRPRRGEPVLVESDCYTHPPGRQNDPENKFIRYDCISDEECRGDQLYNLQSDGTSNVRSNSRWRIQNFQSQFTRQQEEVIAGVQGRAAQLTEKGQVFQEIANGFTYEGGGDALKEQVSQCVSNAYRNAQQQEWSVGDIFNHIGGQDPDNITVAEYNTACDENGLKNLEGGTGATGGVVAADSLPLITGRATEGEAPEGEQPEETTQQNDIKPPAPISQRFQPAQCEEKIPAAVWEEVCRSSDDYAVDPTSDLVTAVQSACLTATSAYLTQYREVMSVARNCLQTIAATGDGSAGVCKEFMSIYVCDLVYNAIQCVTNKVDKGYGAKKPVREGFFGFLSYMRNSGSSVESSIRGRYGSANVYQSLFTERKLLHSACGAAFTGDWDLGLNAVLDTQVATPIKTTCYINGNRRFIGADPNQNGKANFLYNLGVFVVSGGSQGRPTSQAGSQVIRGTSSSAGLRPINYRVELVCSADNSCDSELNPSGACDCLLYGREGDRRGTSGEIVTPVHVGPGILAQGETINEEVFYDAARGFPYRFDRARIIVNHVDNSGREVEEVCAETRLFRAGSVPPAHCQFDIADGEYRCFYQFGERGSAFFRNVDVAGRRFDPQRPAERHTLFIGDTIQLEGEIIKQEGIKNKEIPVWLSYRIWNPGIPGNLAAGKFYEIAQGTTRIESGIGGFDGGFPDLEIVFDETTDIDKKKINPFQSTRRFLTYETTIDPPVVNMFATMSPTPDLNTESFAPIQILFQRQGNEYHYTFESTECVGEDGVYDRNNSNQGISCTLFGNDERRDIEVRVWGNVGNTGFGSWPDHWAITLTPNRAQPTIEDSARMEVELTLHDDLDGRPDPAVLYHNDRPQRVQIGFDALAVERSSNIREVHRCTAEGTADNFEREACDCDGEGATDENPLDDCDGDDFIYCYEHIKNDRPAGRLCSDVPRCDADWQHRNNNACDCNRDGDSNGEQDCDGETRFFCSGTHCFATATEPARTVDGEQTDSSTTPAPSATFSLGTRIKSTTDDLIVRSTPEIPEDTYENRIAAIEKDGEGEIIDGPQDAGEITFWKIQWDNEIEGWSAENWVVTVDNNPSEQE